MHTWKGWAEETGSDAVVAPSWSEWSAHMHRIAICDSQQHDRSRRDASFNQHELARLQFVRWLYDTGRLGSALPIDISTTDHDAA